LRFCTVNLSSIVGLDQQLEIFDKANQHNHQRTHNPDKKQNDEDPGRDLEQRIHAIYILADARERQPQFCSLKDVYPPSIKFIWAGRNAQILYFPSLFCRCVPNSF
jgi:hypothetical protein